MSLFPVAAAAAAAVLAFVLPAAAQDDAMIKRGEYLVNGPGACSNCHGTRNPDFTIVEGMEFAGGFHIVDPAFDVYAANITPDTETGIGNWTDEEIITAIREGVDPEGGIIFPPMPAFYGKAKTLPELIDETVGRILGFFGIDTGPLFQPWNGIR